MRKKHRAVTLTKAEREGLEQFVGQGKKVPEPLHVPASCCWQTKGERIESSPRFWGSPAAPFITCARNIGTRPMFTFSTCSTTGRAVGDRLSSTLGWKLR